MSGIVGIWNMDGRRVDPELLDRLAEEQRHRNADGEGLWRDDSIAFKFQNRWITRESLGEIQPLVRYGSVVMFDGRLDNREELFNALGEQDLAGGDSDAGFVAAAYRRYGEEFAAKLEGDFAIALYDLTQQKLILARDGIGVRPLYYAQIGHSVLFASECKSILAHPECSRAPNRDMVSAYCLACFGQEREGWTFYEGISTVLPGQILVFAPEGIRKRIYWELEAGEFLKLGNYDEYVEAFREAFTRAVMVRLRSAFPVVVSVSGGLDSSSILCSAETIRRRRRLPCPDVRGAHLRVEETVLGDEDEYVRSIEGMYEISVDRVSPSGSGLISGPALEGLRCIEAPYLRGFTDFGHPLACSARSVGARVVLSGFFGDQLLSNRSYLVDLVRRARFRTLWQHVGTLEEYELGSKFDLLEQALHETLRGALPLSFWRLLRRLRAQLRRDRSWFTSESWRRARQAEAIQEFAYAGSAHQRGLYAMARAMYYAAALEWTNKYDASHDIETCYPFYDRRLIALVMSIPGEIVSHHGVPKALLRRAMQGVLPTAIEERSSKGDVTYEFNEGVGQYLDDEWGGAELSVRHGFLDEKRTRDWLASVRSRVHEDGCENSWLIADVVGLELWLQSIQGRHFQPLGG
ncbi:MAG: hypothetical protein JST65_18870 [Acidobacteria bacterium]|nr:hypothetical protein [Acidobacteriota bacterium]